MSFIIEIGGSVISKKNDYLDSQAVEGCSKVISENIESISGIVVGGGEVSRRYIEVSREHGAGERVQDEIGISLTHSNARLLSSTINGDTSFVSDFDKLDDIESKIPVMGGTVPGQTTDAVATTLACRMGVDTILVASNIDGIYDTRGGVGISDAKLFDNINTVELQQIISTIESKPGRSVPIDEKAIRNIDKNDLQLVVFNGADISNIRKAIEGQDIGTEVHRRN
jgi:uridylate kinase